ncbi:hypothetical protein AB0H43_29010 [Hamadaea sp. NPDC050747]|uniref:hypothetical protein n=1 Tax=Hamadaea sp. NPDC050747 TaxID=3155789 RepID=UPI0033F7C8B6
MLDEIVDRTPAVRLGLTATAFQDPEPASPARRVSDLLFLRGTLPEDFTDEETDQYVLPLLDDELERAILEAFRPRGEDVPSLAANDREKVAAFLREYKGSRLLTTPRGDPIETELEVGPAFDGLSR